MAERRTTRTDVDGAVRAEVEIAGPEPAASGPRIHVSEAAAEEIRAMIRDAGLDEEGGLRLRARRGAGCSAPLQYGLFLEEAPEPDDAVLENGDLRLFLDPESAWVLDGLHVDWVDNPVMGEGFAFRHPNGPGGRAC